MNAKTSPDAVSEVSAPVYHRVVRADDVLDNVPHKAKIGSIDIFVVRTGGQLRALRDLCTHADSPLSDGRVRRGTIACPLHGARFDLASGTCVGGAYRPIKMFDVRIDGDWVEVAVSPGK